MLRRYQLSLKTLQKTKKQYNAHNTERNKTFCLLSFTLTVMSIGFIIRVPAHISSTTTFSITGTKKTKECNLCLVLHCVCSLVHSVFMIGGERKGLNLNVALPNSVLSSSGVFVCLNTDDQNAYSVLSFVPLNACDFISLKPFLTRFLSRTQRLNLFSCQKHQSPRSDK